MVNINLLFETVKNLEGCEDEVDEAEEEMFENPEHEDFLHDAAREDEIGEDLVDDEEEGRAPKRARFSADGADYSEMRTIGRRRANQRVEDPKPTKKRGRPASDKGFQKMSPDTLKGIGELIEGNKDSYRSKVTNSEYIT